MRTRTGGGGTAPKITRERVRARFLIMWAEQLRHSVLYTYVPVVVFAVQPERGSGACLLYTYLLRAENVYVRAPVSADY